MPRKNKKSKAITDEEKNQLPADANENIMASDTAGEETTSSDSNQVETDSTSAQETSSAQISADDLLDDVRRSLIEDENTASEKKSKWWKRIGIGASKEESTPAEEPKAIEEIDLPLSVEAEPVVEAKPEDQPDEYLDQIDELIDLLDNDEVAASTTKEVIQETPPEPEKVIDIEELKKQAFQPRPTSEAAENLSEVRSIALEGDEEVFVEVEAKPQDPLEERLSALENALKPYRSYIYFGLAFLGVVVGIIALGLIYNIYRQSRPQVSAADVSTLPFPNSISLPGGWTFKLGKGSLKDGKWDPEGAEWLEGTEVCRWVSLPWSRQLEAVVRTLNPNDPIQLGMSNSDELVYKVSSIRQMSAEEMGQLDTNKPCLLVLLTEQGAEKSWVLTALP